jgi:hypothetical protein
MPPPAPTTLPDWLAPGSPAIEQAIRRASSSSYESWWHRCASVGFCANPIQASAYDPNQGRRVPVLIRCGNRRPRSAPPARTSMPPTPGSSCTPERRAGITGCPTPPLTARKFSPP